MAKNESQKDTTTTETEAVIQAVGELVEDEAEIEVNPSIEELTLQLAEAKQKAESNWESLLRKQADYDNLQKRTARDLNNARQFALEKFATELLAVKDSIELGLDAANQAETSIDSIKEGMALTLKMLNDILVKFNINEIDPSEDKFDPQWHEAMAAQPVPNVENGTILHVHQKGYKLNDRLLRPARVIVAKAMEVEKTPDENIEVEI
jgi:molecular chaperone GrpE